MSFSDRYDAPRGLSRNSVIVLSVIALHVAVGWALQSGLARKAVEVIIPAQVLSEFLTPEPPAPPAAKETETAGASSLTETLIAVAAAVPPLPPPPPIDWPMIASEPWPLVEIST